MRGGSIQAQQLAEFYKSPACAGLEVPKGGALKLLRNVENSGLRFTHMPHLNKWIIALDHDAPPPPPSSDLGASAPAFVPGAPFGYAPVAEADLRFASADVSGRDAPTDRTTAKQRRLAKRAAAREADAPVPRGAATSAEPDPRLRQLRMESLEALSAVQRRAAADGGRLRGGAARGRDRR